MAIGDNWTPEQLAQFQQMQAANQPPPPAAPYNNYGGVSYQPGNMPNQAANAGYSSYGSGNNSFYGPPSVIVDQASIARKQSAALAQATQQAYNQAKQANLQRYGDITGQGSQNPLLNAIQGGDPGVAQQIAKGAKSINYQGKNYPVPQLPFRETKDPTTGKLVTQNFVNGQWLNSDQVTSDMRTAGLTASLQNNNAPLMGGYYGMYDRATANVQQQQNQQNTLNQAYQNRTNTAMGMISNAGQQERVNINNQYNALQGAEESDLTNRGLTASTVGTSVANQVEQQRNQALGNLNDRLTQLNVNTYSPLSGQALQEQGAGNARLGQLGYNTQTQIPGQMLQFAAQRNDIYPNLAQYNNVQSGLGNLAAAGSALQGAAGRYGMPAPSPFM